MGQIEILDSLIEKYSDLIFIGYTIPPAWHGKGPIKAIILGADPTHIVEEGKPPVEMKTVFNLTYPKSPYWRGIRRNLEQLGLGEDDIYVQNVCRNYFSEETSRNKLWIEIARNFWLPFLKQELDETFPESIPVLMTTEFILKAALNEGIKAPRASDIYEGCMSIRPQDNLLGRELVGFYRHPVYAVKLWPAYMKYLAERLKT